MCVTSYRSAWSGRTSAGCCAPRAEGNGHDARPTAGDRAVRLPRRGQDHAAQARPRRRRHRRPAAGDAHPSQPGGPYRARRPRARERRGRARYPALRLRARPAGPGWGMELNGDHVPETEEYGISSTVFRSELPFHTGRLWRFVTEELEYRAGPPSCVRTGGRVNIFSRARGGRSAPVDKARWKRKRPAAVATSSPAPHAEDWS
ncbi:hypothetical protein ADK64_09290 [Streptomyces sp. MMG1121]|nr:hypothetical protein ADK64_09290 [Streptomyces sp. MMG1121]